MCGIVGLLDSGSPIDRDLICRMRDQVVHRGPDDAGVWLSSDGTVGLAHRRLSIVDLSALGHQPMSTTDGRYTIVFNGEIYNFRELRDQLQSKGCSFISSGDTEVLLAAYALWGADCLDRVDGQFAFAIYDRRDAVLFAARDRAGEKPFFYRHDGSRFAFASELKALLADPRLPRKISLSGLNHYLAFGYAPQDKCMLEGYCKLPAGHRLTWHVRTGALAVEKYWNLPVPPKSSKRSIDDLTDELERHLSDAVRAQLLADVPVGVLLSGGLDSSLVTALAARSSSNKIHTYSVIFPENSDHDESKHAQLVSSYFGTEHHELPASEDSIDVLPKLVAQYDEPLADSSIIPTYMVSRLVRSGCTVALGGDGGDELFGGYLHYPWVRQIDRLRSLGIERFGLERFVSKSMKIGTPGRNVALSLVGRFPPEVTLTRLLDPDLRRCLLDKNIADVDETPEQFRTKLIAGRVGAIDRQTALDFETYMCDDILAKVDRASMLNSLEIRAPFLGRKVIEFAFGTVPSAFKVKGFRRKLLLRRLAEKLLPNEFDSTRKKGFTVPLAEWIRGAWKPLIDDLLNESSPFFDRRKLREVTATLQRSDRGANRIFQLALLEAWRRQYRIQL